MKVAIHQPQYWPWPPYIHKIMDADIFVYLDTVQFSKNGFQNRNQVRTKAGATWLTLPVEHHFGQTIRETRIADTIAAEKHFKTLAGSYGKSAGFRIWRDEIGEILNGSGTSLCDIAVASSDWMVDKLNIPTRRLFASELGEFSQTASGLVAEICRRLGATEYLSGTGATTYMNEADFQRIGCRVVVQEWESPVYAQVHAEVSFIPNLSALDLVLSMPDSASDVIRRSGGWRPLWG